MIKKVITVVSGMCLMFTTAVFAQFKEQCATTELMNAEIAKNPSLKAVFEQNELDIQKRASEWEKQQNNSVQKTTGSTYTVAMVFHVVLSQAQIDEIGGTSGIYSRVVSQIEVLNTDFNAASPDTVPPVFLPLKGNPSISFGLAHRTPSGTGTIGIEIKVAPASYGGFAVGDPNVKGSSAGGFDAWDHTKYLNIWVTDITNGSNPGEILGYGYSPIYASAQGNVNLCGVVLDYKAFGKRKTWADVYFNDNDKGRTLVHELGHFFTLNHIWGNTAVGSGVCNDDDGVGDTPIQKDANQSLCPSFPKSNCTNATGGEMFMNFMDYVTDVCMRMFSKGQVTRMQSEFQQGGGSAGLQNHQDLMAWPTGVESVSQEKAFDIFPNPTTGNINVLFNDVSTDVKSVVVTNEFGQVVKSQNYIGQTQNISIDLTNNPKGVYFVKCIFENTSLLKKIVLQ